MKREADCMALTNHPNIVKFIAFEEDILVMELCDGNLADRIHPKGLEYSEFIRVCEDLCGAVHYLRRINMVHRDIKPDNILMTKRNDGQFAYKLGDFGAARILKENQKYVSLYGTFEFLHPDIFAKLYAADLSNIDPNLSFVDKHELWAIGATLFVAATGEVPFSPQMGRDDHKLMFEMISKKQPKDISATETKDGQIQWSRELPTYALGGSSERNNVEAYLAGLLNVCFKMSFNDLFLFKFYFKIYLIFFSFTFTVKQRKYVVIRTILQRNK